MRSQTRLLSAVLFVALGLHCGPAFAQVNPFADDEKAEEKKPAAEKDEKKPAKSTKPKKSDEEDEGADEGSSDDAEPANDEEAAAVAAAEAEKKAKQAAAEEAARDKAAEEAAARAAEEEADAQAAQEKAKLAKEKRAAGRVALTENFGKAELITTGVVLPLGLGLAIGGPGLFGEPDASMTSPELGSVDYRFSIASHGDLREGTPFVFGIFDVASVVYPSALGGFYLLSGLYYWAADEPLLKAQSVNIDHSMIGMAETVGWTALTAGVVHALIGRQRPYAAFERSAYGSPTDSGANLSFFSTTAALSFAMSSYAARDYADWAMRNDGNVVTGVIAPYALLYGLSAIIGYSSIYNQQHYFSDIAVGGLTGALIGNLAYVAHFDTDGNPRRRRSTQGDGRGDRQTLGPTLLSRPDGGNALGLGFSRTW